MAYTYDASEAACTDEPCRTLDRLSPFASSVERTTANIQRFLDRFHGNPPPPIALGEAKEAFPPGYAHQFERLSKAIDHLNTVANALDEIG